MDDEFKPEPPNMAWLLTFADLVSLLITFFVLLYSMKTVDESRWDQVTGALTGVFASEEAVVIIHPTEFKASPSLISIPADDLTYLQNILQVEFRRDEVLSSMDMYYDVTEDTLTLTLPTAKLFSTGDAELVTEGKISMVKLADKLRHIDNRLEVIGHTDPSPALNPDIPSNWELGMLRAIKVANILYSRGVNQNVPAISYGDSRFEELPTEMPIAQKYELARRVDIKIYGDNESPNF